MSNIWLTWGDVFNASLQDLWWGVVQFTPKFLMAVVFFIIGWVLGNIIAKAIAQVFNALKIDSLFKSIGADDFFRRAGINFDSGRFVGQVTKWFVVVVFLLPSLNLLGLDYIASFLKDDVLGFLPKVVVAAFAFIIALGQLGIADYYMSVLFTGIIAMLSLGGALAFGLGGKEAASRFIA